MRNYVVTVKERQAGEPCFLLVELHEDIGLAHDQHIIFEMPEGTDYDYARECAKKLNNVGAKLTVRRI